ncbi:hypothetical protein V5799_011471 [Amblyomma americanum]|uniref:Uncharacterized protein n=1 Tax=Amblyomma americanum TaxID=6943 RepID=A0AAQ4EGY9_AMBAM
MALVGLAPSVAVGLIGPAVGWWPSFGLSDRFLFLDLVRFRAWVCVGAVRLKKRRKRKKSAGASQEVARTRLRQEGEKYRSFFQTLLLVWREEGYQGLYRGLATQLVRQIPNTAIMMATYEAVVYMLSPTVYGSDLADD